VVQSEALALIESASSSGTPLPRYVQDELHAFLRCGVLACGFARARCAGCGLDRLVAFSCKKRGVCPSCGGRRMRETAAELVTRAVPEVPVRQWVLSLPWALRLPVARDGVLLTKVTRIFFEAIREHLRAKMGGHGPGEWVEVGAITFVQRFGGAETAFTAVGEAPTTLGLRVWSPDTALQDTHLVVRAPVGVQGGRVAEARLQLLAAAESGTRVVEQTLGFDRAHRAYGFVVRDGALAAEARGGDRAALAHRGDVLIPSWVWVA
jgi:hypothetical protein